MSCLGNPQNAGTGNQATAELKIPLQISFQILVQHPKISILADWLKSPRCLRQNGCLSDTRIGKHREYAKETVSNIALRVQCRLSVQGVELLTSPETLQMHSPACFSGITPPSTSAKVIAQLFTERVA
ncbi:MAG: hypothetical protein CMM01_22570 [Rhodopirellula sp.]|nr:hypothetical protein [Rhodopirellula sp.]OUX49415.1 MAG: hypothetical protein CBE43_10310 [Rhodopirellula sp. TMED283]